MSRPRPCSRRPPSMRTFLVYLLALSAVATAAAFGFPELFHAAAASGAAGGQNAAPPPVVVAPVQRLPFADTLEALGTVRANESVDLTPNRADHVAVIHFTDGQQVEAGQLLVELNVEEEKARLTESTAVRDELLLRRDRIRHLFEQKLTSQEEFENVKAVLAAAEARVISLQAAIADRNVRAPFAGSLGLRRVSVGAYVQPSTVIATLDDLSVVKLDFTIAETWLPSVRPKMAVTARSDTWPDATFTGVVTTIDTRLDPGTRSATVRAILPNGDRKLRPGMLLKVTVDRGEAAVLQIPEEALIPVGHKQFVMRVDEDDVAHKVEITLGRRRVGVVEVLEGLSEGDRVITEGIVRVRPAAKVKVVDVGRE